MSSKPSTNVVPAGMQSFVMIELGSQRKDRSEDDLPVTACFSMLPLRENLHRSILERAISLPKTTCNSGTQNPKPKTRPTLVTASLLSPEVGFSRRAIADSWPFLKLFMKLSLTSASISLFTTR